MNKSISMYADVVFHNGSVITVDKTNTVCEAVAVKGNKIAAVGDNEFVRSWIGSETEVIDLDGRTLMPGFIDAHMHLGMRGQNAAVIIDCNSDDVPTIDGIMAKIKDAAEKVPEGTWIKATGYEQSKLKEGRHPTRDELDAAAPNHPVQLTRCCLHMGVYNTLALEAGKISPEKFAPGEVIVDENGRMTGLLKETACTYMWDIVKYTKEEYMASFKACNDLLLQHGVTSVCDASFFGEQTIGLYQEAIKEGIIDVRMYPLVYHAYGKPKTIWWINQVLDTGLRAGIGDDFFRLGHVKILLDGSSSGPSAATREPYSHDPDLEGILIYTQEEADEIVKKAHDAGWNVTCHAVGDKAVEVMVNAIEKAVNANPRIHRHRIDHCGLQDLELIKRIRDLNISVVSNPGFFHENAEAYTRYYGDRVDYMFPLKSYLEHGITVALGSDSPVIEVDPMIGIYSALRREDKRSGVVAGSSQCIGLMDAIRMYTINGAYVSCEEDIKGSIEIGKLADMVVLSENIMETPIDRIKEVKTDITMIDGVIKYRR
jgi:predicted amidohydrolase YtcJ